ncbi:MAG: c-type cytochrome [Myxococcaceae bacterium]|jgi:uncharacterized membrane protein|nr:c-type cytochrome [Myxococcaceae bacterium]MCA3013263.1 c-type cytochrome [Myxococcaceae bacterium]
MNPRRRPPGAPLLLLVSLLTACGSASTACDGTSPVTWNGDAQPVISRACTGCHGATGAADGLRLTSAAQVRAARARVEASLANGSMPPRGAPALTQDERSQLASWLACGAPE